MSGYDERARHDEHGRHGDDDEHEQHAGNGTVNHGPSENSGPEESGRADTTADTAANTAAGGGGRPAASSPAGPPAASAEDDAPTVASGSTPDSAESGSPDTDDASGAVAGDTSGDSDVSTESADRSAESADVSTESSGPKSGGARGLFEAAGVVGAGGDGPGTGGSGPDMFGSDELALRRLLHQAVEEIEPTDGTLDHLRRAVPARRARKRQALVGMAAAALFIGTAVPALVHVSNSSGSDADPSMAGAASETQGGANEGKQSSAGSGSGDSAGSSKGSGKDEKKDKDGKGKGSEGSTAGAQPTASATSAAGCAPTQLVAASSGAAAPDAVGAVYGTFTITNVSAASCTVVGGGTVSPSALGAADPARIGTMLHAAGDAASGLPDPATYATDLVLPPGAAYNVKFAWVPSSTCPTGGDSGGGEPTDDPTPTDQPTGGDGGTVSEGTGSVGTQLMRADGTVDGSVNVTYIADGGAPATSTTVPNACAGTVYRTGVLAGS